MIRRLLPFALVLAGSAALAACDGGECAGAAACEDGGADVEDGGSDGTGSGSGSGGSPATDGPRFGDGVDEEEAEDGGDPGTTGTASASAGSGGGGDGTGGWSGAGNPELDCATCCVDEPVDIGEDHFVVRADDSNSFASPLLVDALLKTWDGASALPVRTHEFLNVYAPEVPPGPPEDPREFVADAGAVALAAPAGDRLVAFQVAVRHVPQAAAAPRTVALVVDTSPSIELSIDRLLAAVDVVVDQLATEDVLGVYSWARDPAVRALRPMDSLAAVPLDRDALKDAVRRQIDASAGDVELAGSLRAALQDAAGTATGEGTVLLVSDGSAGVDAETLTAVREAATADVPVRVVGIGVGNAAAFGDDVLDAITDASGGASLYFDGTDAARTLLGGRFRELIEVAAKGVRMRLTLPPSVRIVGSAPEDVSSDGETEVIGQNLAASGTMTFHNVLRWTSDPAEAPCEGVGWKVVDASGTKLAFGTLPLGDAFAGGATSAATAHGVAVVAAAQALAGPTLARFDRAIGDVAAARAWIPDVAWPTHPLRALCGTLTTACGAARLDCLACPTATGTDGGTTE